MTDEIEKLEKKLDILSQKPIVNWYKMVKIQKRLIEIRKAIDNGRR